MKATDEKMSERRSWRAVVVVLAALTLVGLTGGAFGCDTDPEMVYADAGEGGQPSPGEYAEEEVPQIEITQMRLGNMIGGGKTIDNAKTTFYPDETVFVSIHMTGRANDVWLTGNWYHGNELIETTRHRSSPDKVEVTEMHIGEEPGPLPVGDYVVEIRMNEQVIDSLPFKVVPGDE